MKFINIIGAPRSGTTLLGRIIDEHPSISLSYEPCIPPDNPWRPNIRSVEEFRSEMSKHYNVEIPLDYSCVGMKQPITNVTVFKWVDETHTAIAKGTESLLIWIKRDPAETYLSYVDAANKWWNMPDMAPSGPGFRNYLTRWQIRHSAISALMARVPSYALQYSDLVSDPETTLSPALEMLGLQFCPEMLSFYKTPTTKVRGDPSTIESPRPVSENNDRKTGAQLLKSQYKHIVDKYAELFQ